MTTVPCRAKQTTVNVPIRVSADQNGDRTDKVSTGKDA